MMDNLLENIPKFRFIGSKHNILNNIDNIMCQENISGNIFFDVFSGSGVVGRYFKKKYSVVSNDLLYFSYVIQKGLVIPNNNMLFNGIDIYCSKKLTRVDCILDYLNHLPGVEGFIYNNYTPNSLINCNYERKYFSKENGKKIAPSEVIKIFIWDLNIHSNFLKLNFSAPKSKDLKWINEYRDQFYEIVVDNLWEKITPKSEYIPKDPLSYPTFLVLDIVGANYMQLELTNIFISDNANLKLYELKNNLGKTSDNKFVIDFIDYIRKYHREIKRGI